MPNKTACLFLGLLVSCTPSDEDDGSDDQSDDSTDQTEGTSETTDLVVFTPDRVRSLHLTIEAADYDAMIADMTEKLGEAGGGGMGTGIPGGGDIDNLVGGEPIYVPVRVDYDGAVLEHAGVRFKGNSSLTSLWAAGNRKLPFRLNFDEFEDDFPETKNQDLAGHDKLAFSPNWGDNAQLRDAFATEVMASHGLPVAQWTFVEVTVDSGDGDQYWGLYTMFEDPSDDPLLERIFDDKDGNVYKPSGNGADWTLFDPEGFEKKTNEDEADWSDVEAAVNALHADRTDPEAWRTQLESTFDVAGFLSWLAMNTVIVNWDAYGSMAHNYYLHGDIDTKKVTWISWDYSLALQSSPFIGGGSAKKQIFHTQVGEKWPLISILLADPVYAAWYRAAVEASLDDAFAVETATARLEAMHDLISPSIEAEEPGSMTVNSKGAFRNSLPKLVEHIEGRHELTLEALSAP